MSPITKTISFKMYDYVTNRVLIVAILQLRPWLNPQKNQVNHIHY